MESELQGVSVPGAVTWNHAGGWSLMPTPLAVMVCYREGHKRERRKGKIRDRVEDRR